MNARSARAKGPLRAVKKTARHPAPKPVPITRPSEVVELVYQLMMERGGVPDRDSQEKDRSDEEVLMAEAP